MSSGGGGTSTTQTSNIPDYAKPYVMNMLGATQNQLFTTTPGVDGKPGEITGFKPYVPYSSNPQDYFAGPTGLQTGVYNEAAGMQTPGQFGQASGMAGAAGAGQLGTTSQADMYGRQGSQMGQFGLESAMPAFRAGDQYRQSVTDPSQVQSYMSPYQQAVTDITKQAAVRDAQLAQQATNLGSARQGTYGGARQALMQGEREKNLMSNLANIQAQGSQSAYDKAIQQMQYGSNLGLQGIQTGLQGVQAGMQGVGQGLAGVGAQQAGYAGLNQAAGTLGNLGTAQQQGDLNRMNFQNQTGQQQQQYQQNIINQAIQDFATQQQYPMMQLGMMSNMLRGLPMQSMTTQSYQAQPSFGQQAAGLLGTGASLYGAYGRKAGGTIKEYAAGGGIRASLENKIDDIADAGGAKGLQALLSQTKSPQAKQMIMERMREEGIAGAPTGGLGRNMAGGGIIAFNGEDGSEVEDPEMSDEEREAYIKNNEYLQRSRSLANLPGATAEFLKKYNPVTGSAYSEALQRFVNESPADQATRFRKASSRSEQAANPTQEVPVVKTATQRKEDSDRDTALASVGQSTKVDYKKAEEILRAAKDSQGGDKGGDKGSAGNRDIASTTDSAATGIDAALAARRKRLGIDGPGEKSEALMRALEERQAGMGKQNETDRYLRMAEAFAKFGSTAGPTLGVASEALGGFAKGEAAARKEQDRMQVEGMKVQADLEKARRAEARGDLDAAEKFYTSAEDRKNRLQVASRPGEFEKMYAKFAEGEVAAGRKPTFESFRKAYSGADEDLVRLTKADTAIKMLKEDLGYMQLAASKKPEDKQKAAQMLAAVYQRYGVDPTTGMVIGSQAAAPGSVQLNKDQQALLDKYK